MSTVTVECMYRSGNRQWWDTAILTHSESPLGFVWTGDYLDKSDPLGQGLIVDRRYVAENGEPEGVNQMLDPIQIVPPEEMASVMVVRENGELALVRELRPDGSLGPFRNMTLEAIEELCLLPDLPEEGGESEENQNDFGLGRETIGDDFDPNE